MSLERGIFSCADLRVFSFYRGWGESCQATRYFNNTETRTVTKFFLQGKTPKEIHVIMKETLGEHAPSYATVENCVAQLKRGDFSTCDAPRSVRLKTVTTSAIIDKIHELI